VQVERSYRRQASLAVTIVIVAALAADPHQAHSQAQRFLARADVVSVDVSVLDRNRRPVGDLTAADFTILEDGKAQTIEHFERIVLPEPPVVTADWMRDVATDVASNATLADRRLVVLLLDDSMVPFDPYMVRTARETALGVVNRLGPGDLAAVVFSRDNRHAQSSRMTRAAWPPPSSGSSRPAMFLCRGASKRRKQSATGPTHFRPSIESWIPWRRSRTAARWSSTSR
jgi:hypothetical protein